MGAETVLSKTARMQGERRRADSNRCLSARHAVGVRRPERYDESGPTTAVRRQWSGDLVIKPDVEESVADTGERFDPFCHILDAKQEALCFADLRGRRVHSRFNGGTGTTAAVQTCQTCRRVVCPTCLEIEARLPGALIRLTHDPKGTGR